MRAYSCSTSSTPAPPAVVTTMKNDRSIKADTDTLIHLPLKEHRQTFIILHGRGSSAEKLAPALLSSTTTKNETLQTAFPHAKIIFPNAPKSQPSIFEKTLSKSSAPLLINQWFDNWFLPDYTLREQLPIPGLNSSCSSMHKLLEKEIQLVGKENIVLWGSRQGCAVALSTLLTWDGEPFAALVGMSGWLPFNNWVWDFANGDDSDLHRDEWFDPDTYWPKEHEDDEDFDWPTKAIKYFRFELYLEEKKGEAFKHIPVFLGQSRKDKITELGREAKKCLEIIGAKVQMIEYESLSSVHGYSREMLDDAFDFLRDKLGGKSDV